MPRPGIPVDQIGAFSTWHDLLDHRTACCQACIFLLIERIYIVALEFPRWDFFGEENVDIIKGPPLGLRQTEISPYGRQSCCAGPEEAGVAPQVPFSRVEEVGFQYLTDRAGDVVRIAR